MLDFLKVKQHRVVEDPKFITRLFTDARFSVIWLAARVWLGWQWLESASSKLSNPGWMETGEALKGYWTRAVAIPETGRPVITFDWYRDFLQGMLDAQAYTWFAKLVALGELFVGIALVVGAFVGIAAFFGAFMNFNFMLAGSASTNPMLFLVAIFLIFAWKTAGFIGLDYFLLNWLGTPWGRDKNVKPASDANGNQIPVPVPAGD
ncbi:MAG TPA: DoxX family membrane protein [Aggregatilineales bacterium]|nr:DoxX family membrane protein [Aggregatilineales bacterium]